jgi:peptidyl-prolyl cis-trans isomerase C
MVPQFEDIVFKLKKGDVSDPVKTQFGWHLVKLEDRRTKQPPAFEIVKDRIIQSLLLQKAQQTAVGLRGKAKIDIVDPGIKKSVDARNAMIQNQAKPAATEPAKDAAKDAPKDAPADAPKP